MAGPLQLPRDLTPGRALVFRITHITNIPWILDHGLRCASSLLDPDFRPIGNTDLIEKRAALQVPVAPGGTISDYVAFYFTPYTPMLLNIKTGRNGVIQRPMSEIAILVSSLPTFVRHGVPFVFTDRHAYVPWAEFSTDLAQLERIRWPILQTRDFSRDPDDPHKVEQYQAEVLAHCHVPCVAIVAVVCHDEAECGRIRGEIEDRNLDLKVIARPGWYC